MLISWGAILPMAALTGVVSLALLQLYRLWQKDLSLALSLGLALVGGPGFAVWFAIFNTFSLGGLNQDLPIPFFPVSPEDLGCALTVGLVILLFEWAVWLYRKNRKISRARPRTELIAAILPVIVALLIDVYFI